MVIYLNEYLRERNQRRQAHRATHAHALRVTSKRAVAALSAFAGAADAEPILPVAALTPAPSQTHLAPVYAGASILDDAGTECRVPDDPTDLTGDAVWMNSLYEQASLL